MSLLFDLGGPSQRLGGASQRLTSDKKPRIEELDIAYPLPEKGEEVDFELAGRGRRNNNNNGGRKPNRGNKRNRRRRQKRNATNRRSWFWPDRTVYYTFTQQRSKFCMRCTN